MAQFTESFVEQATPAWLESPGWSVRNDASIAPSETGAECTKDGLFVPAPVNCSPERFRAANRRRIENGGT